MYLRALCVSVLLGCALTTLTLGPAWAQESAAPTTGAMSARQKDLDKKAHVAFSAGRYEEAINLLASLYSDYRNPIYLRNIGRCYQNLGDPDRAIGSFEEYLRQARKDNKLNPDDRIEVEGFIRDMQALRDSRRNAAAPATPAPAPTTPAAAAPPPYAPPPTPAPSSSAAEPAPFSQALPGPAASAIQSASPAPDHTTRTLGIIAAAIGVGLGIGGGIALASAWSKYNDSKDKGCPASPSVDCGSAASSVSSANTAAKVLFISGGILGAAGTTLLVVSAASSAPSGGVAIGGWQLALRGAF